MSQKALKFAFKVSKMARKNLLLLQGQKETKMSKIPLIKIACAGYM